MNFRKLLDAVLARLGMQIVPSVDHLAMYPGKVTGQTGQTVDVTCDDVRIGDVPAVPLQLGLPGSEVQVSPGARVLVGWHGGDPRKPYATTWEGGATVLSLSVDAQTQIQINGGTLLTLDGALVKLNGGTLPIARQTDTAGPYPIVGGNPTVLG